MKKLFLTTIVLLLFFNVKAQLNKSDFKKTKLNKKQLEWYKNAKFGMFIHWGLYSTLGKHEWARVKFNIKDKEYRTLVNDFNPMKFDAEKWVLTAKEAGMKWITITTKHHDGFAIYDSKVDSFSIGSTPFGKIGRDPIKELSEACKKHKIKLGFYYSHYQDWDHEGGGDYRWDYKDKTTYNFKKYLQEKAFPQVKEILSNYGDVAVIWFDTPMHISNDEAEEFRQIVKQYSPKTVIGGRIDDSTGDFWSIPDNKVPLNPFDQSWETCMTSNGAWSWREPQLETLPADKMIEHLSEIVSKGGNLLLNTGPSPTGELNNQDVNAFKKVGEWLKVNGEAIYETETNPYYSSDYTCTTKENIIYFHLNEGDYEKSFIINRLKNKVKKMWMLTEDKKELLDFKTNNTATIVHVPDNQTEFKTRILAVQTKGKPKVINYLPTNQKNNEINIKAKDFTIIDHKFSEINSKQDTVLSIKDTRRAWVNSSFEVIKKGKYNIYVDSKFNTLAKNKTYWIRIGNKKIIVPKTLDKANKFTNQFVGTIEFKEKGIHQLTIRPSDWYLKADKNLISIKNIKLAKIK